jgi:hypothetical protein
MIKNGCARITGGGAGSSVAQIATAVNETAVMHVSNSYGSTAAAAGDSAIMLLPCLLSLQLHCKCQKI